jgi:hypothetical protein
MRELIFWKENLGAFDIGPQNTTISLSLNANSLEIESLPNYKL